MSEHFSIHEFLFSATALANNIDNVPPFDLYNNINATMAGLERIRAYLGQPMQILSGYRNDAVNKLVGGVSDSQHLTGNACDFVCPEYGTPKAICEILERYIQVIGIDQLIFEQTWVHVSFTSNPRHQVLTASNGLYGAGII